MPVNVKVVPVLPIPVVVPGIRGVTAAGVAAVSSIVILVIPPVLITGATFVPVGIYVPLMVIPTVMFLYSASKSTVSDPETSAPTALNEFVIISPLSSCNRGFGVNNEGFVLPTGVYYFRNIKETPQWAYVVVNDKTLYNDNISVDFELHSSEESELVYRILAYAGISIQKPEITQVAAQALGSQIQQEKQ